MKKKLLFLKRPSGYTFDLVETTNTPLKRGEISMTWWWRAGLLGGIGIGQMG